MTGLIIKGVLVLIAMAALAYGVHVVLDHFREQGREQVRAELQPQIDQLKADKATLEANQAGLKAEIVRLNQAVVGLSEAAQASQAQAQAAIARAEQTAKAYQSQIAVLDAVAKGPKAVSFQAACQETEALLRRLATP